METNTTHDDKSTPAKEIVSARPEERRAVQLAIGAKTKDCFAHLAVINFVQCHKETRFRDAEAFEVGIKGTKKEEILRELRQADLLEVVGKANHANVYRLGQAFRDGRWEQWINDAKAIHENDYKVIVQGHVQQLTEKLAKRLFTERETTELTIITPRINQAS